MKKRKGIRVLADTASSRVEPPVHGKSRGWLPRGELGVDERRPLHLEAPVAPTLSSTALRHHVRGRGVSTEHECRRLDARQLDWP